MPKIEITPYAHAAVLSRARPDVEFRDTSIVLPNGNREITLSRELYDALLKLRQRGESMSDVIERICVVAGRGLQ
jgi:hypothetical protein